MYLWSPSFWAHNHLYSQQVRPLVGDSKRYFADWLFLVPFICLLVLFVYWLVESFLFASMDKRRETWMANYPGWLWKLGNNEKLGWQQDRLIWLGICLVDCSFRFMLSIKSFQRFRPVFNFVVHFVLRHWELKVCLIVI